MCNAFCHLNYTEHIIIWIQMNDNLEGEISASGTVTQFKQFLMNFKKKVPFLFFLHANFFICNEIKVSHMTTKKTNVTKKGSHFPLFIYTFQATSDINFFISTTFTSQEFSHCSCVKKRKYSLCYIFPFFMVPIFLFHAIYLYLFNVVPSIQNSASEKNI